MDISRTARAAIDDCYEEFVTSLPEQMRSAARHLPLRLVGSKAGLGWAAIAEPVALALPSLLLAQLWRPIQPELVDAAARAHLFALLGELARGRAAADVRLEADFEGIFLAIERQRHRALAELRLLGAARGSSFSTAEREASKAAAAERELLDGAGPANPADFVAIRSAKHSLAFPAVLAAGAAAGADSDELAQIHDLILGIMLGVDVRRELSQRVAAPGSWLAALARTRSEAEARAALRELAVEAFGRAAAAAAKLGADELAAWATMQGRLQRAQGKLAA